jgi:hypothetical protein
MEACILEIPLSDGMFGEPNEQQELRLLEADYACLCGNANAGVISHVGKGAGIFRLVAEGSNADILLNILNEVVDFAMLPKGSRVLKLHLVNDELQEVVAFQS